MPTVSRIESWVVGMHIHTCSTPEDLGRAEERVEDDAVSREMGAVDRAGAQPLELWRYCNEKEPTSAYGREDPRVWRKCGEKRGDSSGTTDGSDTCLSTSVSVSTRMSSRRRISRHCRSPGHDSEDNRAVQDSAQQASEHTISTQPRFC